MARYVAFLRAVNVAGHATVKMIDVCKAFEAAGCTNVRSVIQSGNILFDIPARDMTARVTDIRARLERFLGEEPTLMIRTVNELARAAEHAPFSAAPNDVKLYVVFLARKPGSRPSLPVTSLKDGLEVVAVGDREAFVVSRRKKNGMYGFPNSFIEKELGVPATSRNWSTVLKILGHERTKTKGATRVAPH